MVVVVVVVVVGGGLQSYWTSRYLDVPEQGSSPRLVEDAVS